MVMGMVGGADARSIQWWAGAVGRGIAVAWATVWLTFIALMLFTGDDPVARGEWTRAGTLAAFSADGGTAPLLNRRIGITFLTAAGLAAPLLMSALILGWGKWSWAAAAWAAAVYTLPFWLAAALLMWSARPDGGGE